MERLISSFAVKGKQKQEAPAAQSLPGKARNAKILSAMEREFGAMEEGNPRQMARLAQSLSELHGGTMPKAMSEILRRLEAGEDPDKLDTEYGEELEGCDFFGSKPEKAEGGEGIVRRRRTAVLRDPTLYEMAEYVEGGAVD